MILALALVALFGVSVGAPQPGSLSSLGTDNGVLGDTGAAEPASDGQGSFKEASAAFSARLAALHPPGSPVAALAAALAADGYVLEDAADLGPGDGIARRERPGFMCTLVWIVRWSEMDGQVVTIDGTHDGVCL